MIDNRYTIKGLYRLGPSTCSAGMNLSTGSLSFQSASAFNILIRHIFYYLLLIKFMYGDFYFERAEQLHCKKTIITAEIKKVSLYVEWCSKARFRPPWLVNHTVITTANENTIKCTQTDRITSLNNR